MFCLFSTRSVFRDCHENTFISLFLPQINHLQLNLPFPDFLHAVGGKLIGDFDNCVIQSVHYDSRKIIDGQHVAFFALKGDFRDGHHFIENAFDKGVRVFVVEHFDNNFPKDANYIVVEDVLIALQKLASFHRNKFSFPVLAITGTAGKTSVKEWISHLLPSDVRVIRSPKSFNSQLGVALSLLELHQHCDLAIIEAAITEPGEMERLVEMIQPTYGVLTNVLSASRSRFETIEAKNEAYWVLFKEAKLVFKGENCPTTPSQYAAIPQRNWTPNDEWESLIPFPDRVSSENARTAILAVSNLFTLDEQKISSLPRLALRLETFDGIQNSIIINDTYSLDLEALRSSLEYHKIIAGERKRVVIVGLSENASALKSDVENLVKTFKPSEMLVEVDPDWTKLNIQDAVVLVKGSRLSHMERVAHQLRLKKHTTELHFDWSALRNNIGFFKSQIPATTKMLAMVKAQAYGTGLENMAKQLERFGVDYLGVAYPDEGAELRQAGIQLPILVMNAAPSGFDVCMKYHLIPAVYSFGQLDELLRFLIGEQVENFPIHIKVDTGMKRLGFEEKEIPALIAQIQAQPEISVQGLYSHLATSDLKENPFAKEQIERFQHIKSVMETSLSKKLVCHLANSEAIVNYPEAAFDMVRLGIGMYGVSNLFESQLLPVLRWTSRVSQVRTLEKGESVGYGQHFVADKPTRIATIPVGYADGFRRSLSRGEGGVFIQGVFCPTVGNVCMDMSMVEIGELKVQEGDEVEIIGEHQTLVSLAQAMETIPYEVLTGISKRVHRSYTEEA